MLTAVRSILFPVLFYLYFACYLLLCVPVFLLSNADTAWRGTRLWGRSALWLLKVVAGTKVSFEGLENVPKGASIVAAKHQSFLETLAFTVELERPAFILKKELMQIPLFGTYARLLGMIPVDRSRRGATLSSMMDGARRAAEEGRPIVIFPEGTRTRPGEVVDYRPGVYKLYSELNVPIVPGALNSGVFWPKKTGPHRAGTVRFHFMPPVEPGLPRPELMARVQAEVEGRSLELLRLAYAENPNLPASPLVKARLAESGDPVTA